MTMYGPFLLQKWPYIALDRFKKRTIGNSPLVINTDAELETRIRRDTGGGGKNENRNGRLGSERKIFGCNIQTWHLLFCVLLTSSHFSLAIKRQEEEEEGKLQWEKKKQDRKRRQIWDAIGEKRRKMTSKCSQNDPNMIQNFPNGPKVPKLPNSDPKRPKLTPKGPKMPLHGWCLPELSCKNNKAPHTRSHFMTSRSRIDDKPRVPDAGFWVPWTISNHVLAMSLAIWRIVAEILKEIKPWLMTSMRLEMVLKMVNRAQKSGPKKKADASEKVQKPGRHVQ